MSESGHGRDEKDVELIIQGLPFPPSVNEMYVAGAKRGSRFPSAKLKAFKLEMTDYFTRNASMSKEARRVVKRWLSADLYLSFTIFLHSSSWLNKNGTMKKKDHCNYEKALVDSLCEALGFDDSYGVHTEIRKILSEEEGAYVMIKPAILFRDTDFIEEPSSGAVH